jgi:hypothetical protein
MKSGHWMGSGRSPGFVQETGLGFKAAGSRLKKEN